jgi:hypothetical protein
VRKTAPAAAKKPAAVVAAPAKSGGGFSAFNDVAKREKAEKDAKKEKKAEKEAKKEKREKQKEEGEVDEGAEDGASSPKSLGDTVAEAAAPAEVVSVEAFVKRACSEVEQCLASGDKQEAAEAIREMGAVPPSHVAAFSSELLNRLATKFKEAEFEAAAALLVFLVRASVIEAAGISDGIVSFVENLEDYVVDAPKAEAWLCAFVSALAVAGTVKLSLFLDAGGMFKEGWKMDDIGGFSTRFFVKVLVAAAAKGGDPKALAQGVDLMGLAENEADLTSLLAQEKLAL